MIAALFTYVLNDAVLYEPFLYDHFVTNVRCMDMCILGRAGAGGTNEVIDPKATLATAAVAFKGIWLDVGACISFYCLFGQCIAQIDQKLMWMAFRGHSIRRRSGITSESDLNSLWLQNETPFCGSVLGSVHSHWPPAVQLGYNRSHFGNTFSANYFCNSESRHYGDELLLYNYAPPYDVYYFDSGAEPQIRYPTPDYSPSESPSQECSRLSWLSLPLRIEHTSLIGHLPELQHRVKATLESIMSHEIGSELLKAARGSSSSSTPVKSGGVMASNTVTVRGLFHSLSEIDVSNERSSVVSTAFDGGSSKTNVQERPPLPPNPPSRYRILKYSNVSAQRVNGESSTVCSSSNDGRVLEGKLQAQKGARSGTNGVSGASRTLQTGGHQYPSLQNRTGITSMGAIPNVGGQLANLVSSTRNKKKSTKKDKKTRIRKEDISNPTNFLHKVHVGWDQDGGFSQETYDGEPMDESILTLLRAAGQNPDRMTKEDLDFSYRFITDYQKTTQSPVVPPPPPPLAQQNTQR
uniref:CRIB domain-containing protein n=1 Tax=Parascaris equorum TaxID=6256 RepID=A0A914RJB9_PAREQ